MENRYQCRDCGQNAEMYRKGGHRCGSDSLEAAAERIGREAGEGMASFALQYLPGGGRDTEPDAAGHEWQTARFTGNVTCARCGLLPLDQDDRESPCEGRQA